MTSLVRFIRLTLAAVIVTALAGRNIAAETPAFSSQTWMAENGLPDNSVGGLAQTPDGYLWVATQSSLARFDGFDFAAVPLGETAAVSSRLIRALYGDRRGNVWAALESGPVLCFSTGGVSVVPIANATTRDWAERICEDRDGAIWLAYQRGGVCRIENGVARFLNEKDGVPEKSRGCICEDRDGMIWLAEGDELAIYREGRFINLARNLPATGAICARTQGGIWIAGAHGFREFTEASGLGPERPFPNRQRNYDVSVVLEDRAGRVWIGNFGGGLLCWSGRDVFDAPTPTDDIFALAEDRDRNLWVGAEGGGLTRLRERRARLVSVAQGLPSSAAFSLAPDEANRLYIVSRDGEVVQQPPSGPLARLPRPPWSASCVATGPHGEIWVGTGNIGLLSWNGSAYTSVNGDTALASDSVRALLTTSTGDLLVSGQTSGIHRLHAGGLVNYSPLGGKDYVRAFAEDAKHVLWAGTLAGRLLKIHEDALEDVTPAAFPSSNSIRTLLPAGPEGVWIGFAKHGLGRFSGDQFARAGAEDGLWSDAVSQVLEDDRGNLWMGGDRGYFRISIADFDSLEAGKTKTIRSDLFGRADDIPAVQASFSHFPSAARLSNGDLAFATSAGALIVNAKEAISTKQRLPVYMRSVEIDGRAQPFPSPGKSISVSTHAQRLVIAFTAVSLSAPENVYFRYRLAGYDSAWSEPGKERRATYSRLPPGHYTFRVAACDEAGPWNEAAVSIAFEIKPTLWQSPWVRGFGLLFFTACVAFGVRHFSLGKVRRRLREAEQKAILERERARIARDMHDELGATLTHIALLGDLQNSAPAAHDSHNGQSRLISETARSALASLDEIVWAVNPSNDSVDHVLEYLGQYAAEYLCAAGIRCRLEFPEGVSKEIVPGDARHQFFLAAKEVLHNVVKHSGATEVTLRADLSASTLALRIEDDGCGFTGGPHDRFANGLRNIEARLRQAGGAARIDSAAGKGTCVTLVMPCGTS